MIFNDSLFIARKDVALVSLHDLELVIMYHKTMLYYIGHSTEHVVFTCKISVPCKMKAMSPSLK